MNVPRTSAHKQTYDFRRRDTFADGLKAVSAVDLGNGYERGSSAF